MGKKDGIFTRDMLAWRDEVAVKNKKRKGIKGKFEQ